MTTPTEIALWTLIGVIAGWCIGQFYFWTRGRQRLRDLNRRIADRHRAK